MMKRTATAAAAVILALLLAVSGASATLAAPLAASDSDIISPDISETSASDTIAAPVSDTDADSSLVSDDDIAADISSESGFAIEELPPEEYSDGWYDDNGVRKYSVDGKNAVGLVFIDGKPYYFESDGALSSFSGERTVVNAARGTDDTYLFRDGAAVAGVNGSALYDFLGRRVGGDGRFSLAGSGSDIDTCYLADSVIVNGFAFADGKLRYFEDGKLTDFDGWRSVDGGEYRFESGAVVTGMVTAGNKYCFLDPGKNGQLATGWLELFGCRYYADETGAIKRDGKFTVGGNSYIADKNGALRYGWIKLGADYYYAASDGRLVKNSTVDGYTLDKDGKRIVSPVRLAAQKIIAKAAPANADNYTKLKASFNWLVKNCKYRRDYIDPLKLPANWTEGYALDILVDQRGNCYRYACALAYIAEELGYDAQVVVGRVGVNRNPHGYTQIKKDGKIYICDANMQTNHPNFDWFMMKDGSYHYYFKKIKTFEIKIN